MRDSLLDHSASHSGPGRDTLIAKKPVERSNYSNSKKINKGPFGFEVRYITNKIEFIQLKVPDKDQKFNLIPRGQLALDGGVFDRWILKLEQDWIATSYLGIR
jgi:hypothetical protein